MINSTEAAQCKQTSDCLDRGEAFSGSVCGPEGVCIAAQVIGIGGQGGGGGEAGQSGQAGTAGTAGSAGTAGTGQCVTPKDCTLLGKGQSLCRGGECIPLATKECPKTIGFSDDENPDQVIGVMVPRYGTKSLIGDSFIEALQSAHDEYGPAIRTINQKPPLLVVCDELNAPDTAVSHLLDTLQIKVMIGPSWEGAIQKVRPRLQEAGVITLLPISDNPAIEQAASTSGALWSCKPNRSSIGPYWAAVASETEKIIKKRSPAIDTLQVTLLAARDPSSQALASIVEAKQAFAQTVAIDYDDYRTTDVAYASTASAVVNAASKPNLIVIVSSGDGASDMMLAIENTWPKDGTAPPRPYYLIVGGSEGISTALGKQVSGSNLGGRVLSLDLARSETTSLAYKDFLSAYSATNKGRTPRPEAEFFYDCFWVNQYALFTATNKGKLPLSSLDGAAYTKGITAINDLTGSVERVGTDGVSDTLVALQTGATLNLNGAGSPLDFDLAKGTPQARGSLGCVVNNLTLTPSGLEFDATGLVDGTTNTACP